MKLLILIFIIFNFFLTSCTEYIPLIDEDLIITNWNDFYIKQVYYDSLQIESQNSMRINDQSVVKIILLVEKNENFVRQDSTIPDYVPEGNEYYLNFLFSQKVSREKLYYNFKLQYYIKDESFVEIDTTHLMIQYPYKSAQVFLTADEVHPDFAIHFQDIDLNDNFLFYHPTSAFGLYEYNFEEKQSRELVDYGSGDFIAHDSIYVFMDQAHHLLKRYNLILDTTDLEFDLTHLVFEEIWGLECWQDFVYVLLSGSPEKYIAKFDYNGNYLSSIPYAGGNNHCLTIESDIAYSQDYGSTINRFDLKTNQFLSSKPTPVYNGEGIRIYKDKFYFVDWDKRIIGYLPLSELM